MFRTSLNPNKTERTMHLFVQRYPLILLFVACMAATVTSVNAQIFPSVNTASDTISDPNNSRWSFSLSASVGPTGLLRDSIPNNTSDPDSLDLDIDEEEEEETDYGAELLSTALTGILPERSILAYNFEAGIHYRIGKTVAIGVTAGYSTRGSSEFIAQTDTSFINNTTVHYAIFGAHITIGSPSAGGSLGFKYGIPFAGTVSQWTLQHGNEDQDLTSSTQFSTSPAFGMDATVTAPILKGKSQVLSAGLRWDAVFTDLLSTANALPSSQTYIGTTSSLHLVVNWSFGL